MTFVLPLFLLASASPPVNVPVPVPVPAAPSPAPAPVPPPGLAPAPAPPDPTPVLSSEVARPLRFGFTSTSAFGVTHAKFFNQLLGARLDYRFTSRFAFGASLAYANLKSKDRRVHEVLPEVSSEYRVPLGGETFGLPLRFALGYLPKNGPTLRLGAGLDFGLSDSLSLEVVPLEPMIWLNRERPEVSLNGSIALRIAF
jgi:hypothetical protein